MLVLRAKIYWHAPIVIVLFVIMEWVWGRLMLEHVLKLIVGAYGILDAHPYGRLGSINTIYEF